MTKKEVLDRLKREDLLRFDNEDEAMSYTVYVENINTDKDYVQGRILFTSSAYGDQAVSNELETGMPITVDLNKHGLSGFNINPASEKEKEWLKEGMNDRRKIGEIASIFHNDNKNKNGVIYEYEFNFLESDPFMKVKRFQFDNIDPEGIPCYTSKEFNLFGQDRGMEDSMRYASYTYATAAGDVYGDTKIRLQVPDKPECMSVREFLKKHYPPNTVEKIIQTFIEERYSLTMKKEPALDTLDELLDKFDKAKENQIGSLETVLNKYIEEENEEKRKIDKNISALVKNITKMAKERIPICDKLATRTGIEISGTLAGRDRTYLFIPSKKVYKRDDAVHTIKQCLRSNREARNKGYQIDDCQFAMFLKTGRTFTTVAIDASDHFLINGKPASTLMQKAKSIEEKSDLFKELTVINKTMGTQITQGIQKCVEDLRSFIGENSKNDISPDAAKRVMDKIKEIAKEKGIPEQAVIKTLEDRKKTEKNRKFTFDDFER